MRLGGALIENCKEKFGKQSGLGQPGQPGQPSGTRQFLQTSPLGDEQANSA